MTTTWRNAVSAFVCGLWLVLLSNVADATATRTPVFLYLLVSTASEPVTFGQYTTMADCQADPGWVNGPSAGVWYGMIEEFNEKARRGLRRHRQIDLWRLLMG